MIYKIWLINILLIPLYYYFSLFLVVYVVPAFFSANVSSRRRDGY